MNVKRWAGLERKKEAGESKSKRESGASGTVTLAVEAKDVGMSDWPRGRSGLVLEFEFV